VSDFALCFRHENVLLSALRMLLLFEYQDERLATAFRFTSLVGMGGNMGRVGAPRDGIFGYWLLRHLMQTSGLSGREIEQSFVGC
jgi:hypothetical protein